MDLAAFCWHETWPCEILNAVRGHFEKVQDMTTRGNTRTQFLHLLHAKYPVFSTALTEGDTNTARGKESEEKPHGHYDKGREIIKENLPAALPHPPPHPCTTDTVSVYKCTVTAVQHSVVTLHCTVWRRRIQHSDMKFLVSHSNARLQVLRASVSEMLGYTRLWGRCRAGTTNTSLFQNRPNWYWGPVRPSLRR